MAKFTCQWYGGLQHIQILVLATMVYSDVLNSDLSFTIFIDISQSILVFCLLKRQACFLIKQIRLTLSTALQH